MMPSIPVSILISQQVRKCVQGKTIKDIQCQTYYTGEYQLSTISFTNIEYLIGQKIIKADSNFIYTNNDWLVEFGYGNIRYYEKDINYTIERNKGLKTGGFTVKFVFSDDSCLILVLNSWTNRFNVRPVYPVVNQYPFITKYPLDITDENDFTFNNFKSWLDRNVKSSILEACATAKGAFDVSVSFMNFVLWSSHVHPKTKVFSLTEDQIKCIYHNIVKVINEYKNGSRICEHTDLFGESIQANDIATTLMTSKNYQKPCPKCGTAIDFVSGGGTKLYFCPGCQKKDVPQN